MTKAYDRVSWLFLCLGLKRMGFASTWVDLILRYISSNGYSIIVNGSRHGFFKSGRGLRQGDPISHSLFILSVKLLSQLLNDLKRQPGYKGFYIKSRGPQINHLFFADDAILFCNGGKKPLKMIPEALKTYEGLSGQLINNSKSCFAVADNTSPGCIVRIQNITGMRHQKFPIKYLGCPIITGRKKISHFSDIVTKVMINRIKGWHTNLLSTGGRSILIRHVLLTLLIHLLSVVTPPIGIMEIIEKYLTRFFWSGLESGGKHHWASWENLCYPHN
ncbi:uncharacterized protein LOC132639211 [Lycium barbarum]|uniref:uncharacterized protein LOC132639211 n=1 Tax=Lycium barbarum TaxID=112863 RepID=UPI00293F045E|nr:uncharacterized protein LOC132639211 [Lycium barbarum]